MWGRAAQVPGLPGDEQIARPTGLSLRTVSRRIAAMTADHNADTRFQAGREAARRGWL
jgi:hypothetical protein